MKEKNNEERISRKGKGSTKKTMKMGEIAVNGDQRKESCALRKSKVTKMRGPKKKIQRA